MKKILFFVLLIITFAVHADEDQSSRNKQSSVQGQNVQRSEVRTEISSERVQQNNYRAQQRTNESVRPLLRMKHNAPHEMKQAPIVLQPVSQVSKQNQNNKVELQKGVNGKRFRKNFSGIKLIFPFTGISGIDADDIVGYEGIGSYISDEDEEGWNGIRVHFNSPVGMCSYSYMEDSDVQTPPDATQYLVNGQLTSQSITSDANSQYLYTVTWYDDESMSILQCENDQNDQGIMQQVIGMANGIDRG